MRESRRAISSLLLPQRYQRPLHPLSHISHDKMLSISATLWTGKSKITSGLEVAYGKGQQGQFFFYNADRDRDRNEREREREGSHDMASQVWDACCWHIIAKNRLHMHTQTHTLKAFYPPARDKVISSSSLLFWWMLYVAIINHQVVYPSVVTSISYHCARTEWFPSLADCFLTTAAKSEGCHFGRFQQWVQYCCASLFGVLTAQWEAVDWRSWYCRSQRADRRSVCFGLSCIFGMFWRAKALNSVWALMLKSNMSFHRSNVTF